MKQNILILISLTTIAAWGQEEIHHAPTAEQCKADLVVWRAESKADVVALTINTLLQRSAYLAECYNVLQDGNDAESARWAVTWQGLYDNHAISRAMKFISRHGLSRQFEKEDAKGAR